jgi:hypothetical protein
MSKVTNLIEYKNKLKELNKNIIDHTDINEVVKNNEEVYICGCGNCLFFITRNGMKCSKCGKTNFN